MELEIQMFKKGMKYKGAERIEPSTQIRKSPLCS